MLDPFGEENRKEVNKQSKTKDSHPQPSNPVEGE